MTSERSKFTSYTSPRWTFIDELPRLPLRPLGGAVLVKVLQLLGLAGKDFAALRRRKPQQVDLGFQRLSPVNQFPQYLVCRRQTGFGDLLH